jgi:hypothetical protein
MINAQMKTYNYFTLGERDAYGQPQLSEEAKGSIKMAINIASQNIQDSVLYKDCTYTGLTMNDVNDKYIILYENQKLKVLYVNPMGRYKQVFMKLMP